MAQKTVVRSSQCVDLPDDVDTITLAAIADPGMSAWIALELRAKLVKGETVLVNGATGALEVDNSPPEAAFRRHFEQGVDIVLDYLWGPSAERSSAVLQNCLTPIFPAA
jgi:D-arabinose 1-dehydrogenase-like Zn-dependent alcohol dehydrogenase